jgi:IS30 family transposase
VNYSPTDKDKLSRLHDNIVDGGFQGTRNTRLLGIFGGESASERRRARNDRDLARATAHATQRAAVRRLKPIGDFVHTITFDNGKEFAAHQDIAHALNAKVRGAP